MALNGLLRKLANGLAAGVDSALTRTMARRVRKRRRPSRAERLGPEERIALLAELARRYDRPEHFTAPDGFFPPARAVTPDERVVRRGREGRVIDLSWDSGYVPFDARGGFLAHPPNLRCPARLVTRGPGRPTVILVHGYLGGVLAVEERLWPVQWLLARGFDVCFAVLPLHGSRRGFRGRAPSFPSSDPRRSIEGFRQAVFDLRTLAALLEARGAAAVGLMSMSLGSYVTALLATVQPALAFAITLIPLVSVADFARDTGRFVGTPEQIAAQHAGLDTMMRVVSPLARPPAISAERLLVIGGEGDRLTPLVHARRLSAHFGCRLITFCGGHLLQLGRGEAMVEVGRTFDALGL